MSTLLENRSFVCKYAEGDRYLKHLKEFGWVLSSKKILNRFGSPLSPREKVSEDDLREKCSWQFDMVRQVEFDLARELNEFQSKYDSINYEEPSFGKGKAAGTVWLSIFSLLAIFIGIGTTRTVNNIFGYTLIGVGIALGIPIGFLIASGSANIVRTKNKNEEIDLQKEQIAKQASQLLKNKQQ